MHIHTEACRWTVKADGKRRCLTARGDRERAQRATGERNRMGKRVPRPVDGLEPDYGPCPYPVPADQWHDPVAVDRFVRGEPVGRPLGASERQEASQRLEALEKVRGGAMTLPPTLGYSKSNLLPGAMKKAPRV